VGGTVAGRQLQASETAVEAKLNFFFGQPLTGEVLREADSEGNGDGQAYFPRLLNG
jgi:hypothetical protein